MDLDHFLDPKVQGLKLHGTEEEPLVVPGPGQCPELCFSRRERNSCWETEAGEGEDLHSLGRVSGPPEMPVSSDETIATITSLSVEKPHCGEWYCP